MSGFVDPWPMPDPVDPQPYDQRGACWPWGPCGPTAPLDMRFMAIAFRDDGPIHDDWAEWKTGQLMVAKQGLVTCRQLTTRGKYRAASDSNDSLLITWLVNEGIWEARTQSLFQSSPAQGFEGWLNLDESFCDVFTIIPLQICVGPDPKPTQLGINPVRWYQASDFPYYGT